MKNEDSRGLIRLYKGKNYVPKFQNILQQRKHLNRRRKQEKCIEAPNAPQEALGAPEKKH